jgi:hypothetical protein
MAQRGDLIRDLLAVWPPGFTFLGTAAHLELLAAVFPAKWAQLTAKRLDVLLSPHPPHLGTRRRLIAGERVAGREHWQLLELLELTPDNPADDSADGVTVTVELLLDAGQYDRMPETLAAFAGDPGRVRVIRVTPLDEHGTLGA